MPTNIESNVYSNIAGQFKIPEATAATVYNVVNASSTTITLVSIACVLATGGIGVYGAAAEAGIAAYIRKQIIGKTRGQAIAW